MFRYRLLKSGVWTGAFLMAGILTFAPQGDTFAQAGFCGDGLITGAEICDEGLPYLYRRSRQTNATKSYMAPIERPDRGHR